MLFEADKGLYRTGYGYSEKARVSQAVWRRYRGSVKISLLIPDNYLPKRRDPGVDTAGS